MLMINISIFASLVTINLLCANQANADNATTIRAGDAEAVNGNGGNIILLPGNGEGLGVDGKVGIGTEDPEQMLEVKGNLKLTSRLPTSHRIHFGNEADIFYSGEGFYVLLPNNTQWLFREDGEIWYYNGFNWNVKVP